MRFRRLLVLVASLLAVATASALRSDVAGVPSPDAPVRVLTTEPLRIKLSPTPSEREIAESVRDALLSQASRERDPTLRSYLQALGDDTEYLDRMAGESVGRLDSDAGALAYQLLHVEVTSERVAIAAITAELLPVRSYIATTTAHEDGHALINDQLALNCGPAIARRELARGPSRPALRIAIVEGIYEAGDAAHAMYHREVNSTFRNFQRAAATAADLAIERHC